MDFQINSQQQMDTRIQKFLDDLAEKGYSEKTTAGYRSFVKKAWTHISHQGYQYTLETSQTFVSEIVHNLRLSESSKKHIRISIRRFNDYLSGQPHVFRQAAGQEAVPEIFREVFDGYLYSLTVQDLKPATIEVRRIFATQFLNSAFDQGIRSIGDITGIHVGVAVLSAGSVDGICQKLPHFLKYLKKKGLTGLDLASAVPTVIEQKKLPSVYNKDELLQILAGIDRNTRAGKRNYAIMIILATYGLRAKDLVELKSENVDFQHRLISFRQSKTQNLYQAELLPAVQMALENFLSSINPSLENQPLFCSIHAPFRPLSRSAVWSIVSATIASSVEANGRKRGSHAIRSSIASGLIADDVPYPIVQKILGHTDPNATKRYAAIDIKRLRKCALECPVASGQFLSYLEGGEWK